MPKLTGIDLAIAARGVRADIPVILATGFSEKVTNETTVGLGIELMVKPFAMKQIAEVVRKVLDNGQSRLE